MATDQARFDRMADWAEHDMTPAAGSATALRGDAAAAHGRALLEEAAGGAEELHKLMGGRPGLDTDAPKGSHARPRNFRIPRELDNALEAAATARGVKPSAIMREALTEWLKTHRGAA